MDKDIKKNFSCNTKFNITKLIDYIFKTEGKLILRTPQPIIWNLKGKIKK